MTYVTKNDSKVRRTDKAEQRSERSSAPQYQSGFGNHFATEAVPGALPVGRIRRSGRRTDSMPS